MAATIGGCSAARTLSGGGNARTATCTTAGLATGTHSIVASYSAATPTTAARAAAPVAQVVGSDEHHARPSPARSIRPRSAPASPSPPASPDRRRPVPSISATAGGRSAAARPEPSPAPATPVPRPAPRRRLTTGTHSIVANYAGDANNGGSSSTPVVASRRLREHHDEPRPARSIRPRSAPASPSLPASPDPRRPVPSISATAASRSAAARPEPSPAPATPAPRPAPRAA